MAVLTKEEITGAAILGHLSPLVSIGRYDEKAIDNEQAAGQGASIVDQAVFDFDSYLAFASLEKSGLTTQQQDFFNSALLYYIASEYKRLDIENKTKESCTPDDYRTQALWKNRACALLGRIGTTLQSAAGFCDDAPVDFSDLYAAKTMNFNCQKFE